MKKIFYYIILLFSYLNSFSQQQNDTIKKIPYSNDYIFKDGIYLEFHQFLENNPMPKYKIISNISKKSPLFISEAVKKDTIYYINNNGLISPVPTKTLWGYCENNTVFINYNGKFNRIIIIGSIGFFISQITVTSSEYVEPYNPYYYYDSYYYPMSGTERAVKSDELRRYLIDFKTGQVLPFSYQNLEILLSADTELYQQYTSLRKRKRKKLAFMYLRRFNERNPLYLPNY